MPQEYHIMENEPEIEKLKLMIVHHEKNGASWLAATGRAPILFHDFDNRAESLRGKKGVYVISYVDPQWPKFPDAWQNFLDNISRMEDSLELAKLVPGAPKDAILKTNVIDSMQTTCQAMQRYALATQKDIRRDLKLGARTVYLPGGWDAWNAVMVEVENAILRILALPTDTILILHETAEETSDSTSEKPKYTGRVDVYPVGHGTRLVKYFNEVWRVKLTQTVKDGKGVYLPKVYPLPNYEFDCCTAMQLDSVEEPNILEMLIKHQTRLNKQKALGAKAPGMLEAVKS